MVLSYFGGTQYAGMVGGAQYEDNEKDNLNSRINRFYWFINFKYS